MAAQQQQQQPVAGGAQVNSFSLFPNPNVSRPPPPPVIRLHPNPRPKRSASRERARQEQQQHLQQAHQEQQARLYTPPHDQSSDSDSPQSSPPRHDTTPSPPRQGAAAAAAAHAPLQFEPVSSASPQQSANMAGPSQTALRNGDTPARSGSARSRSSIAKPPLDCDGPSSSSSAAASRAAPAPLRSIFPTYNPDLPLDQQAYGPTQLSPSHIPRAVISRQSYYDPDAMSTTAGEAYTTERPPLPEPYPAPQSPPQRHHHHHHQQQQQDTTASRGPPARAAALSPPLIPHTSTTDQLRTFWKAANGWKAAPSEGRVFCLKLSQRKDAPVYTLSSASQPLYTLRLDPTSASALVSLSRHDPGKTYKPPKADASSSSASSSSSPSLAVKSESKHWQQVLHTTLEEDARRRQPPHDGLVALLMPDPAAKMAVERAHEPSLVAMAERECARLVWDADSARHYLAHPALASPFCVAAARCPAWSRVEYTLEHHESPRHLAKLTRDGTGGGWLEIDTSVASHVEAYYIIDVAVAALLIVAASDERSGGGASSSHAGMETFAPPPEPAAAARSDSRGSGRFSRLSVVRKDDRKQQQQKRRPMEEFELDLESQDGSLAKGGSSARVRTTRSKNKSKDTEKEDKLPFFVRAGIKVTKSMFKCIIWIMTAVFRVLFRCVRSKY